MRHRCRQCNRRCVVVIALLLTRPLLLPRPPPPHDNNVTRTPTRTTRRRKHNDDDTIDVLSLIITITLVRARPCPCPCPPLARPCSSISSTFPPNLTTRRCSASSSLPSPSRVHPRPPLVHPGSSTSPSLQTHARISQFQARTHTPRDVHPCQPRHQSPVSVPLSPYIGGGPTL